MSKRLRWRTLLCAVIFFVLSMSGMLVYANEKAIVITEGSQEQLHSAALKEQQNKRPQIQEAKSFIFDAEASAGERLCIPLKSGVKAENIVIENRYMEKELHITIIGCEATFYNTQAVYGDISGITAGTYEGNAVGVLMKFSLDDIYECKTMLEGNKLYIEFVSPAELYEKIIVINPIFTENEIISDVAKRLKEKLDASDVKAYFTGLENDTIDAEAETEAAAGMADDTESGTILAFAENVNADFVLELGVSKDSTDATKYGTEVVYNDTFFTTGLNSVTVADKVLREVVTQISGRGNGLFPATEAESVIWNAEVPAAFLKVGYLTNEQEATLLSREDYREKIAEGIYQAILQIYEGEDR